MRALMALALIGLTGCAAGGSSRCAYDWVGTLVCEARFHHSGKPATFAMYAYEEGKIVPLYAEESSSIWAPVTALAGAAP